jgi:hypothetical protein
MDIFSKVLLNAISLVGMLLAAKVSAQVPSAIAVTVATIVATFHAEGAQIYECKADSGNKSPRPFSALT